MSSLATDNTSSVLAFELLPIYTLEKSTEALILSSNFCGFNEKFLLGAVKIDSEKPEVYPPFEKESSLVSL